MPFISRQLLTLIGLTVIPTMRLYPTYINRYDFMPSNEERLICSYARVRAAAVENYLTKILTNQYPEFDSAEI